MRAAGALALALHAMRQPLYLPLSLPLYLPLYLRYLLFLAALLTALLAALLAAMRAAGDLALHAIRQQAAPTAAGYTGLFVYFPASRKGLAWVLHLALSCTGLVLQLH